AGRGRGSVTSGSKKKEVGGRVEELVCFQVDIGWAGSLRLVNESTRRAAGADRRGKSDGGAPATCPRKLRGPLPGQGTTGGRHHHGWTGNGVVPLPGGGSEPLARGDGDLQCRRHADGHGGGELPLRPAGTKRFAARRHAGSEWPARGAQRDFGSGALQHRLRRTGASGAGGSGRGSRPERASGRDDGGSRVRRWDADPLQSAGTSRLPVRAQHPVVGERPLHAISAKAVFAG